LAYTFGRKYDKAINAYRAGLELAPRAAHIYANMAMSYMWSGRYDDALKMLNASMAIDSTSVLALTAEVRVLWRSGKRAEAMRVLDRMKKMSDVPPYRFAAIYAVLGDKEKALDYLERAVATRDDNASWIAVAQDFDGIRSDPRFQKLLERSGLKTTKS
jgi:tetratricopeptide (TPR) repeat protein